MTTEYRYGIQYTYIYILCVFVGHLIHFYIRHYQINNWTLLPIYLLSPAPGRLSLDWPHTPSSYPLKENKAYMHIYSSVSSELTPLLPLHNSEMYCTIKLSTHKTVGKTITHKSVNTGKTLYIKTLSSIYLRL